MHAAWPSSYKIKIVYHFYHLPVVSKEGSRRGAFDSIALEQLIWSIEKPKRIISLLLYGAVPKLPDSC